MKTETENDREVALDDDVVELLGGALAPANVAPSRRTQLRERVMARIDNEPVVPGPYSTIRESDGRWIEIGPLMEKKVLRVDEDTGLESYLLRLQPGASPEQHHHDEDELCIVLEGDVSFDDIHLEAGDYHYALKGTSHGRASTVQGALIFLQSVIAPAAVPARL